MRVVINLIPVFANQNTQQTSPEYYQILIDNNDQIISKEFSEKDIDINEFVDKIIEEYLILDTHWVVTNLVSCEKAKNTLQITYSVKSIFIDNCNKKGKFLNINSFMEKFQGNKYVEAIWR